MESRRRSWWEWSGQCPRFAQWRRTTWISYGLWNSGCWSVCAGEATDATGLASFRPEEREGRGHNPEPAALASPGLRSRARSHACAKRFSPPAGSRFPPAPHPQPAPDTPPAPSSPPAPHWLTRPPPAPCSPVFQSLPARRLPPLPGTRFPARP